MMKNLSQRGFALLIALVLTSVVLALGVALLDVAYKQVLLSSSAKNSQYAFYNADSAMECALYYDQQVGAFYYDEANNIDVECNEMDVTNYAETQNSSVRTTTFEIPCAGGGISARVTVLKQPSGTTDIYTNGFNSCQTTSNTRIERGLKVHY